MKEVKYYEAYDGTLFNSIERCSEYEANSKEKIVDDFKKLIVRQSEGLKLTKEGSAFPLAEIAEDWWYAVIVMKDQNDYMIVKRYAEQVGNKGAKIEPIYGKEIFIGIGDGRGDEGCTYNWFYCYGTIEDAVFNYRKTLVTFYQN